MQQMNEIFREQNIYGSYSVDFECQIELLMTCLGTGNEIRVNDFCIISFYSLHTFFRK